MTCKNEASAGAYERRERVGEGLVLGRSPRGVVGVAGLGFIWGKTKAPTTSPRPGGRSHGPQVSVGAGGRGRLSPRSRRHV